jgi:hypothetical protein
MELKYGGELLWLGAEIGPSHIEGDLGFVTDGVDGYDWPVQLLVISDRGREAGVHV